MEHSNFSLLLFTLLTQASAGMVLIWFILKWIRGIENRGALYTTVPLTASMMLLAGLAFSFGHLKYPLNAFNALNNLEHSWMSREILVLSLLFAFQCLVWLLNRLKAPRLSILIIESLRLVLAFALIYIMIRVYSLPSLPELYNPCLAVSFIASSLILGAISIIILMHRKYPEFNAGIITLIAVFVITSYANYLIFSIMHVENFNFLSAANILYILCLFSIVLIFVNRSKNKIHFITVIFLILVASAEVLNRIYLLSFTNPGL
jgi:DMSO reductase anchor subunit